MCSTSIFNCIMIVISDFTTFFIFQIFVIKVFFIISLYFLSKESFPYIFSKEISYISKNRTLHFPAQAQNTKKIHSPKNFLYFRKYNFLTLILKKFLYLQKWNPVFSGLNLQNISLKKLLISFPRKIHSEKISYIFSKESFSYISGNGTLHFSA